MDGIQHRPLPLTEAPIFDLILRPEFADATSVRKGIEPMPDKSEVLAAFGGVVMKGGCTGHARLHTYGPHGNLTDLRRLVW
jgi:hypothetical protein